MADNKASQSKWDRAPVKIREAFAEHKSADLEALMG